MESIYVRRDLIIYPVDQTWYWVMKFHTEDAVRQFTDWMDERSFRYDRNISPENVSISLFGAFDDLGGMLQFRWRWGEE